MDETKVIYHIDDEETPYLVKIPIPPEKVTLADFKNVLNRPNFKFFFKSMDDDFGVVKEEIVDDVAHLPCFNGRVVSWLVSADGSNQSDGGSQCTDSLAVPDGIRHPPDCPTDTESIMSSRTGGPTSRNRQHRYPGGVGGAPRLNGQLPRVYETSSVVSSDVETTSFVSETTGRHTALSECSSVSRLHVASRKRPQRRRRQRPQAMSRTSSYSSITDSTMSLNIITVSLNMDTVNFLGISIVGQSNKGGDGGIYVGSIMKGGAVALDGRIEPGDMILQVNDVNFENMTNDEAVRVLREVVQKPGPIKLVVAKCWDPNPTKGYFTIPRAEPVRPIDPGAWVAHTAAVRGEPVARPPSSSTLSSATSLASTVPAGVEDVVIGSGAPLTVATDMTAVVRAMARPDSGLEIRDRMWLKITIPNAFIGADVVDWLLTHVEGFQDRRDARKYASHLLRAGLIRHTVNKITFSEQCYYIFGDLCSAMSSLTLGDTDSVGPLPPAGNSTGAPSYMPYSGTYNPLEYQPMPFYTASEHTVYGYNRDESVLSGSSNGSLPDKNSSESDGGGGGGVGGGGVVGVGGGGVGGINMGGGGIGNVVGNCPLPGHHQNITGPNNIRNGNGSSSGGRRSRSSGSEASSGTQINQPTLQQQHQQQQNQQQDVAGSRQSFKIAMCNPCELFVDVM